MEKFSNTSEENIKVIVRIKPNQDNKYTASLSNYNESNSILIPDKAAFSFDKVGGDDMTQEDIFDSCKNLFQSFLDGYNATIFAYGQTGSGKTYTMTGDSDATGTTQNPGLIPRGLEFIFDKVNERAINNSVEFLIKCSFVEIYNEQIYDLLDSQLQKLNLRFGITNEVYLEPCTEIVMDNPKMADEILRQGLSNRHMASTEMNRESSRSHAVFTIILESRESHGDIAKIKKSSLHLVDLAGSERQKDAKTDGLRLKEAGMINKSLLALSMVIRKLTEASKSNKSTFITYRDSKLTLLLKDAIGGNSKTSLVACVHSDMRYISDTLSTLQFANSVKMIVNKAKINIDIHGDNEALRKEVNSLREQLENYRSPQTIQEHEFDYDFVWKKRFITAMALRSNLSIEVTSRINELTRANMLNVKLQKSIDNLKMAIELKEKSLKQMEERLTKENFNDDEIKILIDDTLKKLNAEFDNTREDIKAEQMKLQIDLLTNQLSQSKNLTSLALSDQTYMHTLLTDYNNIVEAGDFKGSITKIDANNIEVANLQLELSQMKNKYSLLKKKLHTANVLRRDEKRKMEAEIYTMNSNLKVVDEQREAAVVDRRKTLMSVQGVLNKGPSPINKYINCRRRTQRKPAVIEEINSSNEFLSADEFFKKNGDELTKWDKIGELEKDLRSNKIKMGTMEFNLNEYAKEIEELKAKLQEKENVQKNLHDFERNYSTVSRALEDSNELVKKLQKEYTMLETEKDRTIKKLNDKMYSLEEEKMNIDIERVVAQEKLDQTELSLILLKDEMKRMCEEHASMLQNNTGAKETCTAEIEAHLLKTENDLALMTKKSENQCSQNANLIYQIEAFKNKEHELDMSVVTLMEDMEVLRGHNSQYIDVNEELQNTVLNLEMERTKLNSDYKSAMFDLKQKYKDREDVLKSELEQRKEKEMLMLDEIDRFKQVVEKMEKQNANLRLTPNFTSPKKGYQTMNWSPKFRSSPMAKQFTKDSESRSSLLDDMIASTNKVDEDLNDKLDIIQSISNILRSIFEELQLTPSDSIVTDMVNLQVKMISYKHDIEDLVLKNMTLEEQIRVKSKDYNRLEDVLNSVKKQRDEIKKDLEDLQNMLPNCGEHLNPKQKINNFKKYKEENIKLLSANIKLVDENNNIKIWLIRNRIKYTERDDKAYIYNDK